MDPTHLTFGTAIAPGIGHAFIITHPGAAPALGNRAVAFITGARATGLRGTVEHELHQFRTRPPAHQDVTNLVEFRFADDGASLGAIGSDDEDDENLTVSTPWGVYEDPAGAEGYTSLAIFLRREPTPAELDLLRDRAIAFFAAERVEGLVFRLLRQVVSVETTTLPARPPAAPPPPPVHRPRRRSPKRS